MKKCYAVVGETGEYSDHSVWVCKIFTDEKLANRLPKEYKDEANFLSMKFEGRYYDIPHDSHPDPSFRSDYTGTNYYVEEIDFEDRSFFEKLGER